MDDSSVMTDASTSGGGALGAAFGVGSQPTPQPLTDAPIDGTLTPPTSAPADTSLQSLQPSIQAAQQASAQDLPKLSRVKASLIGFLMGGVPGAISGAVNPQGTQRAVQQQKQIMSAQTADILNKTRISEINLQNLPQELRDKHDELVLGQLKYMTENYGAPDQSFDNSSEAAHEALTQHVANGNVPLGHILSDSKNTYVWFGNKATEKAPAYQDVQDAGVLSGNPIFSGVTQGQWDAMSPQDKSSAWATARQTLTPVAPSVNAKDRAGQILAAKRQLSTAQALPDTPQKARLVNFAQGNLNILNAADNDPKFADKPSENNRTQFLQGIQSSNLPADLKKTYGNFINQAQTGTDLNQAIKTVTEDIGKYQTGIDSAKQKALDAQGGEGAPWVPKATADEKKKAGLGENISFNANEINSILARRPDLVGVIAGRATNVEQLVGNNDPDISAVGTAVHNLSMANSSVHGFRSNEGVKDTEGKILNGFKNGPQAVAGALGEITGSVQTFIDEARPSAYPTHSKQGGAAAYYQKQAQQKQQAGGGSFFGSIPGAVPTK